MASDQLPREDKGATKRPRKSLFSTPDCLLAKKQRTNNQSPRWKDDQLENTTHTAGNLSDHHW